ncbi:MAG: ABC transporter ATP-binding protein [Clostridia bacterium]|nr:ABC transporter ATP-binding protein [Clostridia bacterium]
MRKKEKGASVWGWIIRNGKACLPSIIALAVLATALSLLALQFTLASKSVLDIATHQQEGDLFTACAVLVGLLFVQLVLQISVSFINVQANAKLDIELKRHVFKTLISKDYMSVSKYHSGELLNRLTSDINVIIGGIISIVPNICLLLTSIIGGFIILFRLDRFFALVVLTVGPLLLICGKLYSRRFKQLHKDCQLADGKTRSFMQEALQNILVIKSFNNQNDILGHNEQLQRNTYKLKIKRVKISVFAHICMYLIFNAGYYFALAYGSYKLSKGMITFGTVTAMLQLVGKIQSPFKDISSMIPQFFSVAASVERIMELENMKDDAIGGSTCSYDKMESIVFENVCFGYEPDKPVLTDASFTVNKGEFVVIGGESGIGKSTAIKLMLGIMRPDSGRAYVKTSGGDVELGCGTRELFAYVPQGNLILSGTIRDNVAFGKKDASDEEIIEALRLAQIWDYISTLEHGLDTELGEKGLGLSEGQVQRISIARAILYGAPVLLLDESTSALDEKTEIMLLETLKTLTDKTCILISHKKAAFDFCDKVIDYGNFRRDNN